MNLILKTIALVITKRVPQDVMPPKCDGIHTKFKLVMIPKGVEVEDRVETNPETGVQTNVEKNTGEKAVVRVLIKQKKMTKSEIQEERGEDLLSDGAETEKMIDMDEDDKALAISARPATLNYSVFVIHQYAQRVHRHDFLTAFTKACPDAFQENQKQREIQEVADLLAEKIEAEWIQSHCGEYELPCLDFNVHAPDFE